MRGERRERERRHAGSAATSRAGYQTAINNKYPAEFTLVPRGQAFHLLYVALIASSTFGVLGSGVPPFATRPHLTSYAFPAFPIFSPPMRFFHVLAGTLLL